MTYLAWAVALIFVAAGLLWARRHAAKARVRNRHLAVRRVTDQYQRRLVSPFDAGVEQGPEHTCSFGERCARRIREANRAERAARVREAS